MSMQWIVELKQRIKDGTTREIGMSKGDAERVLSHLDKSYKPEGK
jgi:hypothetical protein